MKINFQHYQITLKVIIILVLLLVLMMIYISYRNCKYPKIEPFTNNNEENKRPQSFISAELSNNLDKTIDVNLMGLPAKIQEYEDILTILNEEPNKIPCYLQKDLFDKCSKLNENLTDNELLEKYNLQDIQDAEMKKITLERIKNQEIEYKKNLEENCKKEEDNCIDIPKEIQFMEINQLELYIEGLVKQKEKAESDIIYYKKQKICEECKRPDPNTDTNTEEYTEECIESCNYVYDRSLETGIYKDENQNDFFKKKLLAMEIHERKLDNKKLFITKNEIDYIFETLKREIIIPNYYYYTDYTDKLYTFKYDTLNNIENNESHYNNVVLTNNPPKQYLNFILKKNNEMQQTFIPSDEILEFELYSPEIDYNNQDEKTTILTYIKEFLTYKKLITSTTELIDDKLKIFIKLNKYDIPKEVLITIVENNPEHIIYEDEDSIQSSHNNLKNKITNDNLNILEKTKLNTSTNPTIPPIEQEHIFDIPNLPEFYNILDKDNNIDYYNFAQQNSNYHNQNLNHNQNIYKTHYQPFSYENNQDNLNNLGNLDNLVSSI